MDALGGSISYLKKLCKMCLAKPPSSFPSLQVFLEYQWQTEASAQMKDLSKSSCWSPLGIQSLSQTIPLMNGHRNWRQPYSLSPLFSSTQKAGMPLPKSPSLVSLPFILLCHKHKPSHSIPIILEMPPPLPQPRSSTEILLENSSKSHLTLKKKPTELVQTLTQVSHGC